MSIGLEPVAPIHAPPSPAVFAPNFRFEVFRYSGIGGNVKMFDGDSSRWSILLITQQTSVISFDIKPIASLSTGLIQLPTNSTLLLKFNDVGSFIHEPWFMFDVAGFPEAAAVAVSYRPRECL